MGTLCFSLLLCACSADDGSAVVGIWKDVNQERYLAIEKSSDIPPTMSAVIYAPSSAASEGEEAVVMNHLSMPASMQDGVLMLELQAGVIPVLYHPSNQLVMLNGTDEYQRVPEDIAQLNLESLRATSN